MKDWDAYVRKLEAALDMRGGTGFRDLFAKGARFADPANAPPRTCATYSTRPARSSRTGTRRSPRSAAVTTGPCSSGSAGPRSTSSTPITMHGATILELDDDGLITSWRDYLDRKEPEDQIRKAMKAE